MTEAVEPLVVELSKRQLDAYNRADVDAFCAVFHDDVVVLDADGAVTLRGIAAFRERYGAMFAAHRDVRAIVTQRLVLGVHVVEFEQWSRVDRLTSVASAGEVLVRYSERDGRVATVQFLR